MLRSFRVSNHKSFRDEAELLLIPAYDKSRDVVPVAGILGANASGKSNLLDALRWLQKAVRESYAHWEPGAGVPRTPFRLDPDYSSQPSLYCVEIVVDGSRYTYGLEVDDQRVLTEWLYTYPHNRRRVIFEREDGTVRLGSTVPEYRARTEQLARQTRDNALFLSVAAHNELTEAQPLYNWFRQNLRFADGTTIAEDELVARLTDADKRGSILSLVRIADLGITNITIESRDSELAAIEKHITDQSMLIARLLAEMKGLQADGTLSDTDSEDTEENHALARRLVHAKLDRAREALASRHMLEGSKEQIRSVPRLRFHHGANTVPLTLTEQSSGTRSWLGLLSAALGALASGGMLIVDELNASLHPHLSARLMTLFRDPETNPSGAQLLFTTHDATLLDEDTLGRDEIWFIEKDPDSGATNLFPLTDFHPRKNENRVGRYLAGAYGAIPLVSDYDLQQAFHDGGEADAAA